MIWNIEDSKCPALMELILLVKTETMWRLINNVLCRSCPGKRGYCNWEYSTVLSSIQWRKYKLRPWSMRNRHWKSLKFSRQGEISRPKCSYVNKSLTVFSEFEEIYYS